MLYDLLQDNQFAALLRSHSLDILHYLFEKGEEFGVVADRDAISFNPKLPDEIYRSLPEFPLFLLVNYTFESGRIENGSLVFEAGFGPENFGSVVTIPVESLLQIIVDETPIFVNLTATIKRRPAPKDSMELFLSNPENRKFMKKG
ncbi:MAG: hypothetical protein GXO19_03375 [Epsilonproteobacteria bacterium]|nr:hypothetical protein [Campylobacterota bacterium]NPA56759.1 hypothetical protein [Campylobacterota bacterium]